MERLETLGARKPTIENVSYNYEGGRAAGVRLFDRARRPDAVFCANDMLASARLTPRA